MDISIVIIARNEAKNINRTLKAAFNIKTTYEYEVLLIDSNSEDETLNIAQSFKGLRCFKLDSRWPRTAAMGRYTGAVKALGEYIVFIDGDMEINPNWIDRGIEFLKEHSDIAVVEGKMKEIRRDKDDRILEIVEDRNKREHKFGGCFIISRADLIAANNFDYNLRVHEEVDLYYRLKENGKRNFKIPDEMCTHYTLHPGTFAEIRRRFINSYYQGYSFFIKKYLSKGKIDVVIKEMGFYLGFGLLQITTIIILIFAKPVLSTLIGIIWLLFLLYKIRRHKRVRDFLFNLLTWECMFTGIIIGILKPTIKKISININNI